MRPVRPLTNALSRRRGVTLLEMLVTVALLLLMMSTIAAIFAAATGSVTVSRTYAQLDQDLRRLDATIRQDLRGVTCKMTPPNDPKANKGYFEYAENALSDAQDEDSDDTLRFTAQAPEGRPFTGRMWVPRTVPPSDPNYASGRSQTLEAIPVTSQYAEIIYFQRGTKLYRRVLLILPGVASQSFGNIPSDPNISGGTTRTGPTQIGFATNLFEPIALFQNKDASGNLITRMQLASGTQISSLAPDKATPLVSWQGLNDISARPSTVPPNVKPATTIPLSSYTPLFNSLGHLTDRHYRFASPRFSDDFQRVVPGSNPVTWEYIPDGVPDDLNADGVADYYPTMYFNSKGASPSQIVNDSFGLADGSGTVRYPVSLRPLPRDVAAFPYVFPNAFSGGIQAGYGLLHSPDASGATFNHNPLPVGDSLPVPSIGQTWWGFPTWRETMAPTWLDPIKRINDPAGAPYFSDVTASALGEAPYSQTVGLSPNSRFSGSAFWLPPQPGDYSDNVPSLTATTPQNNVFDLGAAPVFEDDLIATNVRSFNVKAFDPNPGYINTTGAIVHLVPGYYDLGYASGLNSTPNTAADKVYSTVNGTPPILLDTLGHEGRIPPLIFDFRDDPQYPGLIRNVDGTSRAGLGDDNTTVVRLRRTWDSWSTTYTSAPANPVDPTFGPYLGYRSVVPSYPAPYPVPLRGIEVQIRVTDPTDKHVKTLTIRQDFTEKL